MRVLARALAAALALGAAAQTTARAADVKFGALFPFSGQLALLGEESARGVEIAVDEINAAGGVQGRFAGVSSSFAFLTPFLGYEPNAVTLTLARNDLDFAAVAHTRNQRAAAGAVQAGAVGSTLYDAVATLSAPQARAAFAGMAGDAHAGLASTAFATAGLSREAVLDRLR
ncbi:ABC transporter substrate-binding protein, partial [Halomonas sp. ATBC28]|uniref:ABC transporter substrate-binding protein n=1 Tax=Halomonas sp. ATBC28 TaxID=2545264 RepID=UPI0020177694